MEVFDSVALAEQMGIGQAEFMEIWHREESLKLMNQGVLSLGQTVHKDAHIQQQPEKNGIMAVLEHHSWEISHLNLLIQELKHGSACQKSEEKWGYQALVNANIEQIVLHHSEDLHVLKTEVDNIKSNIMSLRREVFSQLEKVFTKLKQSEQSTKKTVKPNQAQSQPVKDNTITVSSLVCNNGKTKESQAIQSSSSSHSTDSNSSIVSVTSNTVPLPTNNSENYAALRTSNLSLEQNHINTKNDSNTKVNSQYIQYISLIATPQKVVIPKSPASNQPDAMPLKFIGDVNTKAMESCVKEEIIKSQFGADIWKEESSQPYQNFKNTEKDFAKPVTATSKEVFSSGVNSAHMMVPQSVPQKVSFTTKTAPPSVPQSASAWTHSSKAPNTVNATMMPQSAVKSTDPSTVPNSSASVTAVPQSAVESAHPTKPPNSVPQSAIKSTDSTKPPNSVPQSAIKSTDSTKPPNSVPQSAIKSTDPSTSLNSASATAVPQSAVKSAHPTKPPNSVPQPLFIPSDGTITKIPESHLFFSTQEDYLTPYYLTSKLTCKVRLRLKLNKTSRRLHVYVHISATPKVELPIYLTGTGYISAKVSGGSGYSELWQVYSRLAQRPEPGQELVTEARVCLKTKRNTYSNITFDELISMGYGCDRFLVVKWDLAASTDMNHLH